MGGCPFVHVCPNCGERLEHTLSGRVKMYDPKCYKLVKKRGSVERG